MPSHRLYSDACPCLPFIRSPLHVQSSALTTCRMAKVSSRALGRVCGARRFWLAAVKINEALVVNFASQPICKETSVHYFWMKRSADVAPLSSSIDHPCKTASVYSVKWTVHCLRLLLRRQTNCVLVLMCLWRSHCRFCSYLTYFAAAAGDDSSL